MRHKLHNCLSEMPNNNNNNIKKGLNKQSKYHQLKFYGIRKHVDRLKMSYGKKKSLSSLSSSDGENIWSFAAIFCL